MTAIRVYSGTTGKWSEPIIGIDKSFFIKGVIKAAVNLYVDIEKDFPETLPIELNHKKLLVNDFVKVVDLNNLGDKDIKCYWTNLKIDQTTSVMVSLKTLKRFVDILKDKSEGKGYIAPAIQEIIDRADLPTSTPDEYGLILKFGL